MITGLSKSQIENLIEFIEMNFIDSIRDDEFIDNIDYVVDMMDILINLRETSSQLKSQEGDIIQHPYTEYIKLPEVDT